MSILSIVQPVLQDMPAGYLQSRLLEHIPQQAPQFAIVEDSFRTLTAGPKSVDALRLFFHSWSQTNNSAMTVSGLSNRITMLVHSDPSLAGNTALFRSVASLNRIVDEDLAVVGRTLHSDMFYAMATGITGDDQWLRREWAHADAVAFKRWKDRNSLHSKDIMTGLLTTLVHEIYTHGEVEFILPLFVRWLEQDCGFTRHQSMKMLAWISVHCGPTEKKHFYHAVDAIHHFAEAVSLDLSNYDLQEIIVDYAAKKSAVMNAISQALHSEAELTAA